jgi:O-antigen ligase
MSDTSVGPAKASAVFDHSLLKVHMLRNRHPTLRGETSASVSSGTVRDGRLGPGFFDWSARLLDAIIFFCLLGVIVLTSIPYGTVEPWWEAIFESAVFLLTAFWILEGLISGNWQFKRLFILLPLIILTAYAFAQTVEWPAAWLVLGNGRLTAQHTLTIDRYQTYLTARKALALTLFLGLLLLHTSTPKRLRWLVGVVVGLGLASALFGILRQLFQSNDSASLGFLWPYLSYGLGYGQFISANAFAYLMEMTLAPLAGLIVGGGVRRDRLLIYLAIAVVIWTALVLSNSRGGIVSFACQSIFLLFVSLNWYSARRLSREDGGQHKWLAFIRASMLVRVLGIVFIVGTLMVGVFWMGGQKLASKLGEPTPTSIQDDFDRISRKDIWRSSWELIKQNPWTGVGFGAYFLAIPEYQLGAGRMKVEQAHNDYLDLAASGGVVAVGLAGWFFVMVFWRARFSFRSRDAYRRAACLGAATGILGVGVHSLVDFGLQLTSIAVVFAALAVILCADGRVEAVSAERKGK